ncbi:MAG: uracil-DNA glycosylase [Deltaproteobacteria bacterium]|nr:uracil-DNA glycosylase [Deltaproteobacteria bacterium]
MQFDLLDSTHNQILSQASYGTFAKALRESNCRRCPLSQSRSQIVVDRGNPQSKVMIISERPGDNEDKTGLAFVGRAGELLDKIFAAIGMDTNKDLLIVNVVKCLPPTDRAPQSGEVEACRPYLERQIDLVGPKVIILLGAVAFKYVSEEPRDFSMEEEAGKFFTLPKFPGIQFMVLYHPAFLLRDPSKKKPMWQHVQRLKEYLQTSRLLP